MINYPCQHCQDRKIGCHDTCTRYQSVKAQKHKIHDNKIKQLIAMNAGRMESVERAKRAKNNQKVIKCHKRRT